jgi:pilus assembly protein CpaC
MISPQRWTAILAVVVLSLANGAEAPNLPAATAAQPVEAAAVPAAGPQAQTPQPATPQAPAGQTPQAQTPSPGPPIPSEISQESPNELVVTVGKSLIVTTAQPIERISVGYNDVAEATAVSPHEVLVNGKAHGETSLIVWEQGGNKLFFDLRVQPNNFVNDTRVETLRRELKRELPGSTINVSFDGGNVFLRGTVKNLTSSDRAMAIASTLGKPVNLLYVSVPAPDPQILLKVRFASVDRSVATDLGLNAFSTGAGNTIGRVTTGQFTAPVISSAGSGAGTTATATLTDALNVFLFWPHLDFGALLKNLETKGLVEVLAEPNVLAINGQQANFLAGGEFPYPILQGGTSTAAVTIAFREFGVRINFLPTITPRGTLHLEVAPEVSALDFANGLTFQGFNIPALTVRRVHTSIELQPGQSFAIGGLMDNRLTETAEKLIGFGDIPLIGKLFRSRSVKKDNTELLVLITPELVRPIPAGQPTPQLKFPKAFLQANTPNAPRTPGMDVTGPVPVTPPEEAVPVEDMIQSLKRPKMETGASATGLDESPTQPFLPVLGVQPGAAAPAAPAAAVPK